MQAAVRRHGGVAYSR